MDIENKLNSYKSKLYYLRLDIVKLLEESFSTKTDSRLQRILEFAESSPDIDLREAARDFQKDGCDDVDFYELADAFLNSDADIDDIKSAIRWKHRALRLILDKLKSPERIGSIEHDAWDLWFELGFQGH